MSRFFSLGAGTIWLGRQWPPGSKFYEAPDSDEIKSYIEYMLSIVPKENKLVVDTARAYGLSEVRIGELIRTGKISRDKYFLCTKWGENWKIKDFNYLSGLSKGNIDHSIQNLRHSISLSLESLRSIDLLYIHHATMEVMADKTVLLEMKKISKFIGVSISNRKILEEAIDSDLINMFDALQVPAWLYFESFKHISKLLGSCLKLLTINSSIRNRNKTPYECYREIIETFPTFPEESTPVILNGSRNHYKENAGLFRQLTS